MLLRRPSSVLRPLATALVGWLEGHQRLALTAFILSRALPFALRLALLIGPHSDRPFDIVKTWQAARLAEQGLFPYIHYWSEYPPLYPWLSVLIYGLSRLMPLGPDGRLTFYAVLGALLIAAEVGTVTLIYRLAASAYGRRTGMQAALLYTCLAVPLYLYTGWFDVIPAFLFLLALARLATGHLDQSALAAAVGGLFKLFPALAIPIAWRALPTWGQRLRYTASAGAAILAIMAPLALISPVMTTAWAQATLTRSSWETIWALAEGYTGFGLIAPLAMRTDPASATLQAHPGTLPWPLITLALILALIGLFTRPFTLTAARLVVALGGLSLNLVLLFSRGYSPQFLLWVLPPLVVVFPGLTGAAYGLLLSGANLLEYPLYFSFFPQQPILLIIAVLGRTAALIGLSWAYWQVIKPHPAPGSPSTGLQPGWIGVRRGAMRIGVDGRYIADHYPGIGRYTFSLVEALSRLAADMTFVIAVQPGQPNSRYDLDQLTARPNVRLEPFALQPRSLLEQVHWPQAARRWSLDVLHSPYVYKPYALPCPSVVTVYDLIPLVFPEGFSAGQRLIFRLMVGLALRTARAVIAISAATRDDLVRYFRTSPDRVYVTPLAADASFYPRPPAEVAAIRARYGLPDQYVLYVGSNKPHKNLPRLIEAYAKIGDAPPLVLAGREDARYPQARARVEALGLSARVCFPGDIASADLPALYSGASLFVFPSLYEGFGLPPLEAMACGLPVVCSGRSSLPEVVGDAALIVDPDDVDTIASAIRRALDDADLRASLRRRGLDRAAQFSWERTAQETLRIYRMLAPD